MAVAEPARLRLQVFDVRGALMTTLREDEAGVLPVGSHAFVWDGSRVEGPRAPSGAYFVRAVASPVRAEAAIQAATTKLVLIR